ncbi:MAG: MBL fold metallo-hydrolase [Mesorhizobium amorphae]|nr:MAG: MBL fold metallo-hydrolase [Mesorhizobium amorphae]
MADTWNVFVIEYARSRDQPVVDLVNGTYGKGAVDVPFSFVLAQKDGLNVLVDTGFMREGSGAAMSERFGIPEWISPVRMLAELGVGPEMVSHILLSHAHFDHMGSIGEFPQAKIFIQKRELLSWHEAMALPPQFGYLTAIINPDDLRAAFTASVEHRLMLVDGDRENVLPGIDLRLGAGHTMGQQFVTIETMRGPVVVSGDCVYSSTNICGHNHDGVYVPLNNAVGSVWDQLKTIDRINEAIAGDLGRLIILHDTEHWKNFTLHRQVDGFRIMRV